MPQLTLWGAALPSSRPNLDVFLDPANAVAYKMIGGAQRILGAEVLGYYVPRALDTESWGVYVREAGLAWLCSELIPRISGRGQLADELVMRLARAIAAHHLVHFAVEDAFTKAGRAEAYVAALRAYQPRHPPAEEALADAVLRYETAAELDGETRSMLLDGLDESLLGPSVNENRPAAGRISELLADLNAALELNLNDGAVAPRTAGQTVPLYLVLEPHLPEPTATEVRRALLMPQKPAM